MRIRGGCSKSIFFPGLFSEGTALPGLPREFCPSFKTESTALIVGMFSFVMCSLLYTCLHGLNNTQDTQVIINTLPRNKLEEILFPI